MKKLASFYLLCFASILFYQCSFKHPVLTSKNKFHVVNKIVKENEYEDGIKEAQEMEFKLTRDVSLGYIPKDRLTRATNELYISSKNINTANRQNALGWIERGPYLDNLGAGGNDRGNVGTSTLSGRIRAIWVDLNDATNKTVWVGSASGGLWKTTNIIASPANWVPVNDFLSNLAISSICQNPIAKNTLFFGTGEKSFNFDAVKGGGIWKSIDGGITWTLLPNTILFSSVSKLAYDLKHNLYASTRGTGIWRSADDGATWTNITPTGASKNVIEMNLSSNGTLHIVYGYYGNGISGYSFTKSPSVVNSNTWSVSASVFTNSQYNTTLASKGDTLYALPGNSADETDQVWKSVNGGINWSKTRTTPPVSGPTPLSSGQAWYCQGLAVDPTNANNIMVGGLNSYKSMDGGATWNANSVWNGGVPGSVNYIHADHQVYVWSAGNKLLCASDGGLFYSANGGSTFTDRNQGLRIKQFYSCAIHPTLPNYFLAGAQDNGVHQLNGQGLASSLEVIGGDGAFVHIDENEPNYQFGAYVYNQYRRSTDGGNSFYDLDFSTNMGQFINPTDYDDINNNLYGAWSKGNYVRWINAPLTDNYFATPVNVFNNGTISHVHVSHYTSGRVLFGLDNGKIVRVDNANTASPITADITGYFMPVGANVSCISMGTSENNLLATFSNYGSAHVWLSTTGGGGSGWKNISGNLPDVPVRWAMFTPEDNTKAILATEMGIFETSLINGPSTVWVQNTSFPNVRTDMLKYRYSDNTILAATHGRGLWSSIISPQAPYIRFSSSYIFSPVNNMTTSATGSNCRNYKDYILNMHIDAAPAGNAIVNLIIKPGATASQGKDFDFTTNGNFTSPSSKLTFANALTVDQPITIRIYNQAKVGNNMFFTLNYTITGSNANAAPSSSSYTFNIGNNNLAPVPSTYNKTFDLGVYNINITNNGSPFRGDVTKNRIQYLFTASELTAAGISNSKNITSLQMNVLTKNSTKAYLGFTIGMSNTNATTMNYGFPDANLTKVYSADYSTVIGNNLFNFSTPFVWDGISNVLVSMCFDNGAVISSYDVVSGTNAPLGTGIRGSSWSNGGVVAGCSLGAWWVADYRPTATLGIKVGIAIDSVLNDNNSEFISDNAQYYTLNGSNIISSLNNSSINLGCVNSSIFRAGKIWSAFSSGQASQKVIQIMPSNNISTASYTVGLYYTLAELGGKLPARLKIAKTSAITMATANSTNTVTSATTVTAFGAGYLFTANFTGLSKYFLIDSNVVLPVKLGSFSGILNNLEHGQLQWSITNQFNLRNFEVQRSDDGLHFTTVGVVEAIQTSGTVLDYNFIDPALANPNNYYRFKMVEADGNFRMSEILLINNTKLPKFVALLVNPVKDHISILLNNNNKENVIAELYNSTGQLMKRWEPGKVNGFVNLPFGNNKPAASIYNIRIGAGDKTATFKISIQ